MNNIIQSFGGMKGVIITLFICIALWLFFDFVSENISRELALVFSFSIGITSLIAWWRIRKHQ